MSNVRANIIMLRYISNVLLYIQPYAKTVPLTLYVDIYVTKPHSSISIKPTYVWVNNQPKLLRVDNRFPEIGRCRPIQTEEIKNHSRTLWGKPSSVVVFLLLTCSSIFCYLVYFTISNFGELYGHCVTLRTREPSTSRPYRFTNWIYYET